MGRNRSSCVLLLMVAILTLCFVSSKAKLKKLQHAPKADGSLRFLVIGDWGRNGADNQSLVAFQMGVIGEKMEIDFVISTGDNFYDNGLTGVYDPAFEESFTNIYTAPSSQKKWYNVLGNHDYRGNAMAQISPVLGYRDNRWVCFRSYVVNSENVDLVFVDTTPFVKKYFIDTKGHSYDWRGVLPRKRYISKLLRDVDLALRQSTATWKVVIGHHTIKSVGHHGDTQELLIHLLPVLQANNVDLYINGHDHCLEHISSLDSSIEFLTSGGGSRAWRGDEKGRKGEEMKFYYDGQGFMSVHISQIQLQIAFYDVFGNVMHQWNTSKFEMLKDLDLISKSKAQ
ncbi:purple acid phosphatase 3 isoform X2 [Cajanus cajan]|uniref:purple acid phosphatase 3 isoform X2 n=1 Tax=Cajanus cajan TaxID=3821 RepID=UPI00098DB66A|nr:purple acid phosphatase 3 isoform X2 [Cajanus cajan]